MDLAASPKRSITRCQRVPRLDENFPTASGEISEVAKREVCPVGIPFVEYIVDTCGDRKALIQCVCASEIQQRVARIVVEIFGFEVVFTQVYPL